MRRFAFILSFFLSIANGLYAQELSTQDAIKSINKIKMDSNYLYAESTNKEWEEAYDNAKALLSVMISEWAMENAKDKVDLCVANSQEHILAIKTRRGELYRSFVYVKKNDIIPISNERNLMVVKMEKETVKETPPIPQTVNRDDEKNKANTIKTTPTEDAKVNENLSDPLTFILTTEERMKQIKKFDEVNIFIEQLKKDNKLKDFGKYKTMPENENCYLLVYNPQGMIPAVLKKDGNAYFNLNTHQADNITNYKGCGAVWFQLK